MKLERRVATRSLESTGPRNTQKEVAVRVAVFSARPYDEQFLGGANAAAGHELTYLETRLSRETGRLATGFEAVCVFVNDELDADLLGALQADGLRLVALRAAGFNNVDVVAAQRCGVAVARVPAYSPHAVAEHTLALCSSSDYLRQLAA